MTEAAEGAASVQDGAVGQTRRDMLKKTALAGGFVWAAPTLLAAPAGAQVTGDDCRTCENNGILYRVKISSQTSANCGQASINLRGDYGSGPGAPRCGTCLFDSTAIQLATTEEFVNGRTRQAQLIIDERLRLVEVGAKFVDDHTKNCEDNFVLQYNPGNGQDPGTTTSDPTLQAIVVSGSSVGGTGPTIIDFYDDFTPINFVDIVVCYAAGGTDFPGCDT